MENLTLSGRWDELSRTYYTQFFEAGGPIVWFVLLPMSVLAIYFIVEMCILTRRKRLLLPTASSDLLAAAMHQGTEVIPGRFGKRTDLVSRAVCAAYEKTQKMQMSVSLLTQVAAENLQEQAMYLLRRAEWCSLLGTVAPMVGLFGTVWGMIEAFNLLGISAGQPKPTQLASAISVALVTTFWGLMVGIPSLFMYGLFRMRIEGIISEAAVEVETLLRRLAEVKAVNNTKNGTKSEAPVPFAVSKPNAVQTRSQPAVQPKPAAVPVDNKSTAKPVVGVKK